MLLVPLTAACMTWAAHSYELPEAYLYAILKQEAGHVGEAVHNKNGTDDLGPFQINTAWGPDIGRYWRIPTTQALERVKNNGCANAIIATAIFKKMLIETKGDYAKAIGFYHSHTEALAAPYRSRVLQIAAKYVQRLLPAPVYRIPTPRYLSPLWSGKQNTSTR
jgi:hypothetical protein